MSQVVELPGIGKGKDFLRVRLFRSRKIPGSLIADSCRVPCAMDLKHAAEDNVLVVPLP